MASTSLVLSLTLDRLVHTSRTFVASRCCQRWGADTLLPRST
jgi:hypothetical protein